MTGSRLHADALAVLRDWEAPTQQQARLRDRYVAHLTSHPDGMWRACYPDHLTASTLVLSHDRSAALLTLHRKANAWFQLGGHCDPDDATLAGAAGREAAEESGLSTLTLDPVPLRLDEHEIPFCDPRGGVRHLDVWFLAVAPAAAVPVISGESADLRWWPLDGLPDPRPPWPEAVRLALSR